MLGAEETLSAYASKTRETGFDQTAVLASPFASGLAGMRERVQLLGGKMEINSGTW